MSDARPEGVARPPAKNRPARRGAAAPGGASATKTAAPPEAPPAAPSRAASVIDRPEFRSIPFDLTVRIASGDVALRTLVALEPSAIVPLETPIGEPAHLLVSDHIVADGEIVEIKGRLQIRITRIGGGDA